MNDAQLGLWPGSRSPPWLEEIGGARFAVDMRRFLDGVASGEIDTWDYGWLLSCWRTGMVGCLPAVNLVNNLGFEDLWTTHCQRGRSPLPHDTSLDYGLVRLRCLLLHCSSQSSLSVGSSTRQSLMGLNSHRLRKLLALTAAAAYIPSLCLGWWDAGHMLTVAIARQRLSNATKTELDRLIAASESVQATSPVPSTSLVSAGHWPDDVKRRDWAPSDKVMLSPSGLFVAFDAVRTRPSPFPC